MRLLSTLLLVCAVAVNAPSTASAASPNSIALRYQEFPDDEKEVSPPNSALPTPMPKHANKPNIALESATIDKLHEMVLQNTGGEQDGFIQLSDTEFIVFVSNTGRVGMGLYLADLATNTWSEQPFAHGEVTVQSLLKDKSGNDYLLMHQFFPMHAGLSGESYSLLSARRSDRGRVIIDVMSIGESEEYDDSQDECARDSKGIVHRSVTVSVADVNHDGQSDISVTENIFNCATKSASTRVTYNLATQEGFAPSTINAAESLPSAAKNALAVYSGKNASGAAQVLEKAGIKQILYKRPSTMQMKTYVGILNDYAFYIGPYEADQALDILDHVIQISPDRGVSYLNRAEVQYQMLLLGQLKTQKEKQITTKEIMANYDTYKKLTNRKIEWLEQFSAFNLGSYPQNIDVCEFVRRYYEAHNAPSGLPRMDEITLESRHIDINNDGIEESVEFEPGKVGYKTYSAISFNEANGKLMRFVGSVSKKPDQGWGFKIFSFDGKIYKLLPMNDVSYIDHDKEKLACESQWGDIPAGGGWRPLIAVRPVN